MPFRISSESRINDFLGVQSTYFIDIISSSIAVTVISLLFNGNLRVTFVQISSHITPQKTVARGIAEFARNKSTNTKIVSGNTTQKKLVAIQPIKATRRFNRTNLPPKR